MKIEFINFQKKDKKKRVLKLYLKTKDIALI